jgi:ribosome modulation factor
MAKNKQPDEAGPGPGHNSVDLTEEQRRAQLIKGCVEIEELQESVATLRTAIGNVKKRLKAVGIERFEVDYALRLRRVDETEELDKRRREARIAAWCNHPIGTQPDLFSDEPDRTPSVDKSFEDGKIAGMEGRGCEAPTHLGQEQQQSWIKGWGEGQELLAVKGFSPLSDAVEDIDENETEAA